MRLANGLYEEGIYAPGIRPPTVPHGMGRVRFSVTALHTEEHLQKAHEALKKVGRRIGIV
jgi:7-keto-8-aminopelargonate synthetase-like enzyme